MVSQEQGLIPLLAFLTIRGLEVILLLVSPTIKDLEVTLLLALRTLKDREAALLRILRILRTPRQGEAEVGEAVVGAVEAEDTLGLEV